LLDALSCPSSLGWGLVCGCVESRWRISVRMRSGPR
jgi:hypothetical protein